MATTRTVCRSIEIGLRVIGCWPDSPYTIVTRLYWLISTLTIQTFQYWYLAVHYKSDNFEQLMDCISVAASYSLTLVKIICLWSNCRIFYHILADMARDWKEYAGSTNMLTMKSNASLSRRCANVIISLYVIASILYGTGSMVSNQKKWANAVGARELLFRVEFPFDSTKSPIYEVLMITLFLHEISTAMIVGLFNALILALMLHIGGQIDIMCQGLMDSGDTSITIMRTLISKHQRIIIFSANIQETFSQITFSQFFTQMLIICSLGYQISVSLTTEDSYTIVKALCFYLVSIMETFIFCFAGEYLKIKSKAITDAVYQSLWYNMKPNESRILLFVIMRSQKQLTLMIGKFMDLSFERFTVIMKASVSYISLLHTLY